LRHNELHDCLVIFGPNLQELGGVCVFDPTNHVLLSLLDATQEYKKCNKFGNVVNACSNNVDESIQIYKIFTH